MPYLKDLPRKAGAEKTSTRLEVEVLAAHAAGISREELLLKGNEIPPKPVFEKFCLYVDRWKAGEPVSRIVGQKEFWSLDFKLNDATLVPRPDSETLVEAALNVLPKDFQGTILDLGTGTGCLLLAVLSERLLAAGVGIDCSEKALECARENAKNLGFSNRAVFQSGDWLSPALPKGPFDLIISNPPYIESAVIETLAPEVRDFDPRVALDGGLDGLDHYRAIAPLAFERLEPGGWLVLEIGETQEKPVRDILTGVKYKTLETRYDLADKPRVVAGQKP